MSSEITAIIENELSCSSEGIEPLFMMETLAETILELFTMDDLNEYEPRFYSVIDVSLIPRATRIVISKINRVINGGL